MAIVLPSDKTPIGVESVSAICICEKLDDKFPFEVDIHLINYSGITGPIISKKFCTEKEAIDLYNFLREEVNCKQYINQQEK